MCWPPPACCQAKCLPSFPQSANNSGFLSSHCVSPNSCTHNCFWDSCLLIEFVWGCLFFFLWVPQKDCLCQQPPFCSLGGWEFTEEALPVCNTRNWILCLTACGPDQMSPFTNVVWNLHLNFSALPWLDIELLFFSPYGYMYWREFFQVCAARSWGLFLYTKISQTKIQLMTHIQLELLCTWKCIHTLLMLIIFQNRP